MNIFLNKLATVITTIAVGASSFFGINASHSAGSILPTPVAQFQTSLASSISSSDTTMSLVSATDKEGVTLASSTYGFILDEGTGSDEFVLANCTGTACTGMTRGISVTSGTTSVASLKKAHRRGASVKITDAPLLLILTRIASGQDSFPNKLSYGSSPSLTNGNDIPNKTYVDTYGASSTSYVDSNFFKLTANNTPSGSNNFTGTSTFSTTTIAKLTITSGTITATPSVNSDIASKSYVDGVAIAGAPVANNTTTGIGRTATSTQYSTGYSSTTAYFLTSAFASSTASTTNIIVSTNTNGKIDPSFLNGSAESYTFNGTTTISSSTKLVDSLGVRLVKFGGTGSDGALSVSSGTTTIDLGSAAVVTKNYSSISITGTGRIAFSNPNANGTIIVLKSQGNVTITSSNVPAIEASGMGSSASSAGNTNMMVFIPASGAGGNPPDNSTNGTAGVATVAIGAANTPVKDVILAVGTGGGNGGSSGSPGAFGRTAGGGAGGHNAYTSGTSGTGGSTAGGNSGGGASGGRGGGALYIECGGLYNVTSTLYSRGLNGGNGVSSGAGGGAGGGGSITVRYNSLTVDSGTYSVTAGTAGTGDGGAGAGGAAGVGYTDIASNNDY